jgi:hypothetical protein
MGLEGGKTRRSLHEFTFLAFYFPLSRYQGIFFPPGVKPFWREFDFSPFSAEVNMSRAIPFLPCISSWRRQGQLYLLLFRVVRRLSKVTELVYLQFM